MGFSLENGYVPVSFEEVMDSIMEGVNEQFGTTYTTETFLGTQMYKYAYAVAQKIIEDEIKTSEIMLKVQDYFIDTNQKINNPTVVPNGILQKFSEAGYTASIKPMINADAGKISICVDVDDTDPDYAATKLELCNLVKDTVSAGVVSQGSEVETLTLTNGQEFDFKYLLPQKTEVWLRLTVTVSRNNQTVIGSPESQKQKLMDNIAARYSLGKDFEPERYYTTVDAPWAADILLEYSLNDGVDWDDATYESDFDELFVILLENIELIEA